MVSHFKASICAHTHIYIHIYIHLYVYICIDFKIVNSYYYIITTLSIKNLTNYEMVYIGLYIAYQNTIKNAKIVVVIKQYKNVHKRNINAKEGLAIEYCSTKQVNKGIAIISWLLVKNS